MDNNRRQGESRRGTGAVSITGLVLAMLLALTICAGAEEVKPDSFTPFPEPPPAMIWGNYMQVFSPALPTGSRQHRGVDVFPFLRRGETETETYAAEVRQAQAYGLDGFQVWPHYNSAARWLDQLEKIQPEKPFYIHPQIGGIAMRFFPTYEDFRDGTIEFLREYGDHPYLYRYEGRPVISSWGWCEHFEKIDQLREEVREAGHEFFWFPTVTGQWPESLAYRTCDGYNAWHGMSTANEIAAKLKRTHWMDKPFVVAGTARPGYDNGNRMFLHARLPWDGAKTLLDTFDASYEAAAPWTILVTWNDVSETASYPSWRSPWGYQQISRFYKGVYKTDQSPFERTRVVVAYMGDQLLGDDLEVQLVLLPRGRGFPYEWSGTLELRDHDDRLVHQETVSRTVTKPDEPVVIRCRMPTLALGRDQFALVPYVTDLNEAPVVRRRLRPIHVRYSRLRTFTPVAIALDRVRGDMDSQLNVDGHNEPLFHDTRPVSIDCDVTMPRGRRLDQFQIADGAQILYDPRQSSATRPTVFLAIDNWGFTEDCGISVSEGSTIRFISRPHRHKRKALQPVNARQAAVTITSKNLGGFKRLTPTATVAIETADIAGAELSFTQPELKGETSVGIPLAELARRHRLLAGKDAGTSIRLRLAEDGVAVPTAPDLDASKLNCTALLPVTEHNERVRVLHGQGVLENGDVFYTKPLVWIRDAAAETVEGQVVASGGAYDDFVTWGTSIPKGPFPGSSVGTVDMPRYRVPHYALHLDEGLGWYVNDGGCYTTPGWCWRAGITSRKQKFRGPDANDPQWVDDGALHGSALRFQPQSRLGMRSRSMFSGAFTLSMWLRPDSLGRYQRLFCDAGETGHRGPLQTFLTAEGHVVARRNVQRNEPLDVRSKTTITAQEWSHIAVTYDLKKVRIYVDGTLDSSADAPTQIVRSHSTPFFGAVKRGQDDGFAGILDEMDLVGRALSPAEIKRLHDAARPE